MRIENGVVSNTKQASGQRPNGKHIAIHFILCHIAIRKPPSPSRMQLHDTRYTSRHIKSYKIAIKQLVSVVCSNQKINVYNFRIWRCAMRAIKFIEKRFYICYTDRSHAAAATAAASVAFTFKWIVRVEDVAVLSINSTLYGDGDVWCAYGCKAIAATIIRYWFCLIKRVRTRTQSLTVLSNCSAGIAVAVCLAHKHTYTQTHLAVWVFCFCYKFDENN